jgi:membrane protein
VDINLVRTSSRGWAIARYCARHLSEVRAPDMAAALSFRTLFGMIPVLFVATLLIRALTGDEFPKFVTSMASMAGLDEIGVTVTKDGTSAEQQPVSAWIEELVRVSGTIDLSALGFIGLGVVLFSAIWLIVAIEKTFNLVCRAPSDRPWHRRLLVYWTMLTLGPVLLATLPFVDGELKRVIDGQPTFPAAYGYVRPALGFVLLLAVLLLAYGVMPTVRMRWKTLLAGAFVAAVGIELGRKFLAIYMERAFSGNRLYGSLGLVPLFMFWVYAMWLIILFGLQVSSLLNALLSNDRVRSESSHPLRAFDPALVVSAMEHVCGRHQGGKAATFDSLMDELAVESEAVHQLCGLLAANQLVLLIPETGQVVPARAADQMRVADVLCIGFDATVPSRRNASGEMLGSLRAAQLEAVGNRTFARSDACQDHESTAQLNRSAR